MLQVTFAEVAHSLHSLGSAAPVSEGHGCLCGALCTDAGYTFERWRAELLGNAPPQENAEAPQVDAEAPQVDAEARRADEQAQQADEAVQQADEEPLRLLFSGTAVALGEATEEFALLLPDDDVALEQRTSALAQWASGFLYGFGTALPPSSAALPPSVVEVLSDFARMAAATVDPDSDTEEQEQAYAELVEYMRAGVWLLYAELASLRASDPDAAPASLH